MRNPGCANRGLSTTQDFRKNLISKKRFWEDFSTLEFSNLDIEKIVAVLPIAAIEQHGPHLPVGVDSIIIESLVNIISERLPKNQI